MSPANTRPRAAGRLDSMQARSALFDVYGDHLRARGGRRRSPPCVRLLDPVGIAAPAVRTAISRMVTPGLAGAGPARRTAAATARPTAADRRLDEAGNRIYRTRHAATWDGRWHLLRSSTRRPTRGRRAAGCAPA